MQARLTTRGGARERATTVERRQSILDAALPLFATRGLAATSIGEICAASGSSNGSIYHHFGSKEGIAATLYANAIEDYQRGAIAIFQNASTAETGFRGCIEHFLRWVNDHRDLATLMLAVEHSDVRELAAEQVAALNQPFVREVGAWIAARETAGELPNVAADLLMPALLGPARRFAELWLEGRTRTSMAEAGRTLGELAWAGFGGAAGTPPRRRARRTAPGERAR